MDSAIFLSEGQYFLGCTREAIGFTGKKEEFEKLGAVIIGVSPDTAKSYGLFIEKHNLTVLLLSAFRV